VTAAHWAVRSARGIRRALWTSIAAGTVIAGLAAASPGAARPAPAAPRRAVAATAALPPGPQRLHAAGGDDLLLYGPGTGPDRIMRSRGNGSYTVGSASIFSTYARQAPGDFDRDGDTDVLLDTSGGTDRYLQSNGDGTFKVRALSIAGPYTALVPGDVDGDGDTDVVLYGRGSAADRLLRARGDGTFAIGSLSIMGDYEPVAADIDRDGNTDIVLVGPGSAPDRLMRSRGDGTFAVASLGAISSEGTPVPGDFDADGRGDVLVYPSELLLSNGNGTFRRRALSLDEQYQPVPVDHDRDGDTDLVLYQPSGRDLLLRSRGDGTFAYGSLSIAGSYVPIPGDFDGSLRAKRGAVRPPLGDLDILALLVAIQPQPGTALLMSPPPITGHAGADARIQSIAVRRGYRLRSVATGGLSGSQGVPLQPAAANALGALRSAAAAAGHSLSPRSGFRSVSDQRSIFLRELRAHGSFSNAQIAAGAADAAIDDVLRLHSIPGYSRHHSGYAVDLRGGSGDLLRSGTSAEVWLRANRFDNALDHGFLPSYPPGGGAQGPVPEAWEYAYVGTGTIRCAGWHLPLPDPAARWSCPLGAL
jgi:hypothetical protein